MILSWKFIAICEDFSDSHAKITATRLVTHSTREMTRRKWRLGPDLAFWDVWRFSRVQSSARLLSVSVGVIRGYISVAAEPRWDSVIFNCKNIRELSIGTFAFTVWMFRQFEKFDPAS